MDTEGNFTVTKGEFRQVIQGFIIPLTQPQFTALLAKVRALCPGELTCTHPIGLPKYPSHRSARMSIPQVCQSLHPTGLSESPSHRSAQVSIPQVCPSLHPIGLSESPSYRSIWVSIPQVFPSLHPTGLPESPSHRSSQVSIQQVCPSLHPIGLSESPSHRAIWVSIPQIYLSLHPIGLPESPSHRGPEIYPLVYWLYRGRECLGSTRTPDSTQTLFIFDSLWKKVIHLENWPQACHYPIQPEGGSKR